MLKKEKLLSVISNGSLELIILPTEQCNFRCTYCYEDFSIGKMKPNTVTAIKRLIRRRIDSLGHLKITWFGGEPLAAKDIVYDIGSYVLELQKSYPALTYRSDMTTNGFRLNLTTLLALYKLGVTSFQVSLDGTGESHDKTRKRMDHSGTFNVIWHNLLSAKHSKIEFSMILRIHIIPDNVDDVFKLIEMIKENFSNDKRFSIFFKAIENLGGPHAGTFKTLRGADKAAILQQCRDKLGDSLTLTRLDQDGPYICYAAATNSFMIRADGKIGKCTVALSDHRNSIGELLEDGTVQIAQDKLALWTRGIKSQQLDDLSCPMYRLPNLPANPT